MSGDKRSVSTDALETLGTIIDSSQKRDAIHLAVIPATAAVKLFPGQDVGLTMEGAGPSPEPRGIVDPFLKAPVQPGEMFWLVIYPRQITSLRHVWTHPAFPEESLAFHAEPDDHYVDKKAASEAWLRKFCDEADCPGYLAVMAKAEQIADGGDGDGWDGDSMFFQDRDAHGDIPAEFWAHVEVVLGKPIQGKKATHFSCSC